MCGILGCYATHGVLPELDRFRHALFTMRHRGPDGDGVLERAGVMLGHVRLAIIDPGQGQQPWVDAESGVAVVFNGEIYNHVEERAILEAAGHRFRTRCDTEVLARMYLAYGRGMVERLNGMFAFAIHDPRDDVLFCARDHAGIKPFYLQWHEGVFRFASEIKGLVNLGGAFEPDRRAIADYLHLQYVLGEKSFCQGVERLLPGEWLAVGRDGRVERRIWWSPEPGSGYAGDFAAAVGNFRELMEDAVRLQLRSDVPLGAHLSGGLDTGALCALAARRIAPASLHTFSAGFDEGGVFDDTPSARVTAGHVGSVHHDIFPTAREFADLYPRLLWHLDEPAAGQGVFPQYAVSRLARERVKVVLGGQGADEILGGYTRYFLLLLDQAIRAGAERGDERVGLSWEALGRGLGQLHGYGPLWSRMQAGGAFESADRRYWRLIDRADELGAALDPGFAESLGGYDPFESFSRVFNRGEGEVELLDRVLHFETTCWLPALLHIEDRMSMAVSLESRVPFLDPRVMRFARSLPTAVKLQGGRTKAVLREAFGTLYPIAIRDRRDKLGFPVPTNRWFAGPLRDFVRDLLTSRASLERGLFDPDFLRRACEDHRQGDFDRSLWGLLNLELWFNNLQPVGSQGS